MRSVLVLTVCLSIACKTSSDDQPSPRVGDATPANATPAADTKTNETKAADGKQPDAKDDPKAEPSAQATDTPSETADAPTDPVADAAGSWWVVAHRPAASMAIGELVDGSLIVVTERAAAIAPIGKPFGPPRSIPPEPLPTEIGPSTELHPALVERIGGRWPDDVWVVDLDHDMRAGSTWHVRHLTQTGWQRQTDTLEGVLVPVFSSLSPWKDGTVLAKKQWKTDEQVVPNDNYAEDDADVKAYERAQAQYERKLKRAAAKAQPQLVVLGGTAAAPVDAIAREPGEILALPSGDIFTGCDAAGAFVHHKPDGTSSAHPLPASASTPLPNMERAQLLGRTVDRVYCLRSLGTQTHAARFDGKTWTELPVPGEDTLVAASVGRDGSLWALFGQDLTVLAEGFAPDNALFRVGETGAWEPVALETIHGPDDKSIDRFAPIQLVVRDKDDIFVAGPLPSEDDQASEASWVVLHSRAPASVLELPG